MRRVAWLALVLACGCRAVPTEANFEFLDADDALMEADADGTTGNGETIGDDKDAGNDTVGQAGDVDAKDAGTDAAADTDIDTGADVPVDPCAGKNCDDGNPCTADSCAKGACAHVAKEGAACDVDACHTGGQCAGSVCKADPIGCDDANPCTTDSCDAKTGCQHVAKGDGTACVGDKCLSGQTCQGGSCTGGTAPGCNDGKVCTDDACDSTTGCSHVNNTAACSDNNACTEGDTCDAGTCSKATAKNCDDANVCTDDSCDNATGCTHANNAAGCDDGNACTEGDTCDAGTCGKSTVLNCDDANPCTDDSCAMPSGCIHTPIADGGSCQIGGICTAGACACTANTTPSTIDDAGTQRKLCVYEYPAWGNRAVSPKAVYADNSNGTISDLQTHLMWQQGQNGNDVTWSEAVAYCDGLVLAGKADWRLPTLAELESLTDLSKSNPSANATYFADTQDFWSTAPALGAPAGWYWLVRFSDGFIGVENTSLRARCVRGGEGIVAPKVRFEVNTAEGTVFDHALGLTWQRWASAGGYGYAAAPAYCTGLAMAGSTNWRIPTVRELRWLADRSQFSPSIDASAFPNTVTSTAHWSGTPSVAGKIGAWYVEFLQGTSLSEDASTNPVVRCVVDNQCPAGKDCDDGNPCTTDSCNAVTGCVHANTGDGALCGASGVCLTGVCTTGCFGGTVDGNCDGDETLLNCPADCAPMAQRLGPACAFGWPYNGCSDEGYTCVDRSAAAGGPVCVADLQTWPMVGAAHPASDFTDATDYVIDNKTGLWWAKQPLDAADWGTALSACKSQSYGGFADWRLSTPAELASLVNRNTTPPSAFGPGLVWPADATVYWASRMWVEGGSAWRVDFADGTLNVQYVNGGFTTRGRCVRTPPQTAATMTGKRFALKDNGLTMLDRLHALRWQQGHSDTDLSPADAVKYCANNTSGLPGTGWRLPTYEELATLVYREGDAPAIYVTFDWAQSYSFWSSTPTADATGAWYVNGSSGGAAPMGVTGTLRARCVKDGCTSAASCDDGNACTVDTCAASKTCTHTTAADWTVCGAGLICDAGACQDVKTAKGMAYIAAGTFWMGCNSTKDTQCAADEKPQHKVTLSGYYMDLTETTVGQYKACVDAGTCSEPAVVQPASYASYPGLTDHPVTYLTWFQAQEFCTWRGSGFDLPSEAQWEMAARGDCEKNGSTAASATCAAAMRTFPWGEAAISCTYAVMSSGGAGCGGGTSMAVGSKPAGDSPYGLHDMSGNVWEWTRDWYSATYYGASPATDPVNTTAATDRVDRGGSFWLTNSNDFRPGIRDSFVPTWSNGHDIGFRCMRAYP